MKTLNKTAAAVLDLLTEGMTEVGAHKKFDNAPGSYMAVSVEKIGPHTFSVAHYFEQNGDLCPDPEMVFWKAENGEYACVHIQQTLGFTRAIELDGGDNPAKFYPRRLADQTSFASTWMRNIKAQQGLKKTKAAAV